jgi:elongation factor P
LKEGDVVDVVSNDDNVLYAELAPKVALKITYTEPGLKGDTATNALNQPQWRQVLL